MRFLLLWYAAVTPACLFFVPDELEMELDNAYLGIGSIQGTLLGVLVVALDVSHRQ